MQLTAPNWYRPVYSSSRKLSTAKWNYSTTERKALGMIYNINKFKHYLLGKHLTFHVDHATLLYLVSKQTLIGKLARSMLLLQEFEFDIQHWPSTQHAVADYLHIEAEDPEWKHTSHEDKWLIEMSTFLNTGLPPPRMQTDEKNRMAVRSQNFLSAARHSIPQRQRRHMA